MDPIIKKCKCNCERCAYKERCGGCVNCEAIFRCSDDCSKCFYSCRSRPNAAAYLDALGEFELLPNDKYASPYFIPTIPSPLKESNYRLEQMPWVGIHGLMYMTDNGLGVTPTYQRGFDKALNVKEGTKAVLHFYMQDIPLEAWWSKADKKDFYDITKRLNFSFVVSPNFSVYEDAPRFEHMLNIKRSMLIYNDLRNHGIPAIPDVSWATLEDLKLWAAAITHSGIKTIAFSFQTVGALKASHVWKDYMLGLRYLCENIPEDVKVVGVGISSEERASAFLRSIGNREFSIISSFAYFRSRSGAKYGSKKFVNMTFDELLLLNIKMANDVYEKLDKNRK